MSKLCIIGLDGATFTVIDYLVEQKRLPNFSRLMDEGSHGTLLSTAPPLTWPAWASFFTGTNPGKTGAADLFKFRPGTYKLEPMNAGNLHGTPFWSLAGSQGKRVCVYNVPVTYPAVPVNGILISGLDAPGFNDKSIYPLELREKLLEAVPEFRISFENDAKYLVNNHKEPVKEWIRQLKDYLKMEIKVINYLMQLEDWDLFVSVIRSTDIFQHTLWADIEKVIAGEEVSGMEMMRAEAVFACYESIDRELGESWSRWGSDRNLIIMSDHGFGCLRGIVSINRVLAGAGLLKFRPVSSKKRSRSYLVKKLQERLPLETRQRIKRFLGRGGAEERWFSYVDVLVADIDWERTKICSIGGFGCLYVNLKGRDPLGTVSSEEERQEVLAAAETAISELRDPRDGQPMVTRFYRKEDIYHGPLMPEIPDLIVDLRDWAYCTVIGTASDLAAESIIREPTREWKQLAHTGAHRREGILVLHGPDVDHAKLKGAQMVDIAPTALNIIGISASRDYDGQVLEAALSGGRAKQVRETDITDDAVREEHKPAGDTYSDSDEEEIRNRLSDLGYL
ncbi:type I phosphodiesterase / nucleotide pyrophosphatase [bacterium BMS3Abin01]|nr:type I phosphodiesterase / nucleotide pyrophosphatase [bacterium BMS3Abin01]